MPLTIFFLQSDTPIPLIPPPPAPLNIPPSRARRQLAARLALHKQQAEEAAARNSDDPFASLGDRDEEGDASDPFTLDEEEEDITSSGRRDKKPQAPSEARQGFSVSRGLTSLFSSTSRNRGGAAGDENEEMRMPPSPPEDDEDDEDEDGSSGSSSGEQHHPAEAAPIQERIPLETDEDEDEEMGEMVAPSEDADEDAEEEEEEEEEQSSSSDDQAEGEVLSPVEKEKLRGSFGSTGSAGGSRPADGGGRRSRERKRERDEDDEDDDDDEEEEEEEGEGLVEIAMPSSGGRRMT